MTNLRVMLAIFGLCIWLTTQSVVAGLVPEEGKLAPGFSLKTLGGQTVDSANSKGKVTILHFWATWCDTCRKEFPAIEKYYLQHKNGNLQIIAISMDDKENDAAVRDYVRDYQFSVAFERDSRYQSFGRIWATPITFVIDRQGILVKDGGAHPWVMSAESLESTVTPLLL